MPNQGVIKSQATLTTTVYLVPIRASGWWDGKYYNAYRLHDEERQHGYYEYDVVWMCQADALDHLSRRNKEFGLTDQLGDCDFMSVNLGGAHSDIQFETRLYAIGGGFVEGASTA